MAARRTQAWRSAVAAVALTTGLALAAPIALLATTAPALAADGGVTVTGLQTNGRTEPLGIPGRAPSFSWHGESSARGVMQSAYEVRVASTLDSLEAADVWDSGKVSSADQVDVTYGGPALDSQSRYYWQVRTWDAADQASEWSESSWFETGMLTADDWQGDWITRDAGAEMNRWTDYTTTVDFHLDNLAFGVFFRGETTANAYMWQLTIADGTPRLKIHKRTNGSYSVVQNKDISEWITASALAAGDHVLAIETDGSSVTTSLDGTEIDSRSDTSFTKGYVGLRTSQASQGAEAVTVHHLNVTAENGDTLLDADFENGENPLSAGSVNDGSLELEGDMDAWYAPDVPLPLLRDEFSTETDKTVASARLYASARGVYELELNGEPVGDQHLAPGDTNYNKRIQSQTYDVTDLVAQGDNAIGAELGAGWYAGRNFWLDPGYYGTDTSLIAQLRIDYTDGTQQVVSTDDSWTAHDGPFLQADNIDGETYDATLEQDGFSTTDFDDSGWMPVDLAADTTDKLVPQPDEPVRTTEERPALARTEPTPGVYVYDLGQNMVGVARLVLQGEAGDTVQIRYGEVLNPDGSLYTANLRTAKATDFYTFAEDGTVTYEPTFTFHGFRYVEVTGTTAAPATADVTGQVWGSDLQATGDLETSDPMLNQLVSNISWGQRGNFLSIPTDTPARDERLGWLGDINVFAPTASYLSDTRAFMSKWLTDLRDSQRSDGSFPGVAPDFGDSCCSGGTAWEDAMITVPYAVWHAYGDTALVRENYEAMETFFAYVRGSAGDDLIDSDRNVYGDWLNLDDDTPAGVMGTAYFAENARMLSEMAAAIGEDADAAEYAALSEDVRAAFADAFIEPDGTVGSNSQTGYALTLGMDLVPEDQREAVGKKFVAKVHASDDHLTTGFVGTPWLLPALTSIGEDQLAYQLLLNKTYPSWGYEIEMGATTMWERWDSIKEDGSFGDVSMNSFNHYAYGAVGDWMYENIGGIEALEPGYKKTRIAPNIGGGLTHGKGDYESAYGRISTDWTLDGDDLSMHVEIPVNTTAEVVLPADSVYAVSEGGALLTDTEGISDATATDDGTVTFTAGSGSYDFEVTADGELIGSILEQITALRGHVDDLAEAGDLAGSDRDHLDELLGSAADDVTDALLATLDGDDETVTSALHDALVVIQETRAWVADSSIDRPVQGDLDSRLAKIEADLERAVTASMGITVTLPPVTQEVLPGGTVTGTIEVTNEGTTDLTDLEGTVSVEDLGSGSASLASVPAGQSAQLPVTLTVPKRQAPGEYDAQLALSFTSAGEEFLVTDTTSAWVSVSYGLTIGEVDLSMDEDDRAEYGTLHVPVTNDGTDAVRAHVKVTLPDGWRSVPSEDVLLPAGETTNVDVPVIAPLDVVGGKIEVSVEIEAAGVRLASAEAAPELELPVPPTAEVFDHVDFGDSASESAHAVQASASSGTSTEAGYTRRYAHTSYPGAWYSVELDVPAGEPFLLRSIETFDGARTKKYHVYVDDVLVKTQLVPRTETGAGIKVYDALIDDPEVLDNEGTVRVKFEYPVDADGYFDPSLADTWVLGVPEDTEAPVVSAVITDGTRGDNGWYQSDATVTVTAEDNRDPEPLIQTGEDAGWQDYTAPVTVSGEGKHTLSFRASDSAGNSTQAATLPVWIDGTAPSTELEVSQEPGVGASDSGTLDFTAEDQLSGVDHTLYRVDGGDWMVAEDDPVTITGYGDHTVDYASTDVAGNAEVMRRAVVNLADVEVIAAVVAPQISGTPRFGSTLEASSGTWNTEGLTFSYQWLRDGKAIAGATSATHRLVRADVGHRLKVKVTASKAGLQSGTSTSRPTSRVAKAPATVTAKVSKSKVRAGQKVRVTAKVTADGARPSGKVVILVDGKKVKKVRLKRGEVAKASTRVAIRSAGKHTVKVRYLGSATVAGATSKARTVKVVRRSGR